MAAGEFLLALEWAGTDRIDGYLANITMHHGTPPDLVTGLLVAVAGSQAWRAREPAPPGLPNLPAFCRAQAQRMLHTVRRRPAGAGRHIRRVPRE